MKPRDYIEGVILGAAILITGAVGIERCSPAPQVAPQAPFRERALVYPFKDNSPTLRAAEAKVNAKIDRVIQQWNSTCVPNGKDCGFYRRGR
jgi:hypothetical protein